MKKTIFFILMLAAFSVAATAQNKKIAILETVDKKGDVPYGVLLQLRSNLTYAISNTPGYEGYDRVDMAQIIGEHDFQRTGLVSDEQIRKLGAITGCSSILVAEAAVYNKDNIIITAKILNVETASVERSVPPQISSTTPMEMQKACVELADMLLAKEPEIIEIQTPETKMPTDLLHRRQDVYGNSYYLGEQRLSTKEYVELINSCPEAKYYYEKGCKQIKTGKTFLLWIPIGAVATGAIVGTIVWISYYKSWEALAAGIAYGAIFIGIPSALVSIPFYISGNHKKNNAYKIYNQYCIRPTATLSVGPATNSIGLGVYYNF